MQSNITYMFDAPLIVVAVLDEWQFLSIRAEWVASLVDGNSL